MVIEQPGGDDVAGNAGWLDVHTHFEVSSWEAAPRLEHMDRTGVTMQLLSNLSVIDPAGARASNEFAASVVAEHPGRFGLLATLPLTDVDAALEEIAYAKRELDVDGFATLGVVDGRYLGDPRFAPVWAELSRQRATVLVHPSPFSRPVLDLPTPLFEVGFDTARVVVDMLWHRTLEAAPDVRVVLPHAGGCFPALSGRVSMLAGEDWVDNTQRVTASQIEEAGSRFWYDTAMSGSLPSLSALLAVTSPDHVLYGSDFGAPCASEDVLQHNVRLLRTSPLLSPAERDGLGRHGAELFPHAFARMQSPVTVQG